MQWRFEKVGRATSVYVFVAAYHGDMVMYGQLSQPMWLHFGLTTLCWLVKVTGPPAVSKVMQATMNRPAPVELCHKNMRFLITHNPTDSTLSSFVEVRHGEGPEWANNTLGNEYFYLRMRKNDNTKIQLTNVDFMYKIH